MIFDDCFNAFLKLFSIVRLLSPRGDFISHSFPKNLISGVGILRTGMNSTSLPDHDRMVATMSSCGWIIDPLGTLMFPIFFFLTLPPYHILKKISKHIRLFPLAFSIILR